MTHTAAFHVISFSSSVGTWRPPSLAIFHYRPALSSLRLLTCRCNLGDHVASTSEELQQSRKELLSPKELHHLRKKKERKVLRKRKKELLEKKRLEELANLPVVKPNYSMFRFENSMSLEGWNKPRKKKIAVSPRHGTGVEERTSSSGEVESEASSRSVSSWSAFEAVYRDRMKSSLGGNDVITSEDEIMGQDSGHYESSEVHQSESYLKRFGATRDSFEILSGINSETSKRQDVKRNGCEINDSGITEEVLEQRDSRKWLQEQNVDRMESVSGATEHLKQGERATYRKKVARVIVGERNGAPVYLSTEDDDSRDKRKIRRDDLNEHKQLEWLARQLNDVNLRADGVHFSRLMRRGGLKITDGRAVILLQLLRARGNWKGAMRVVEWLSTRHQYPPMKSRYVFTTLLAVLGQSRRPTEAMKVFKVMCEDIATYPDMAAYHSIAVTLGQAGCLEELLDLIHTLRRGPKNTKYSLKLEKYGALDPDIVIFNGVLNACVPHKDWKCAMWVLDEIRKQKLRCNSASYGLAIEVMVKAGKLNLAFETLEKMEVDCCHPNSLTFKVLVEGLAQEGKPDTAVALVKRMEQRGIVPTSGVYFALANTLCKCGRWKEAILQVGRLMEMSDKPLVETYTGLITACEKGGHWQDAISVFKFMQEVCAPNIGTYNIMIALYGRHKLFTEAKCLFDRLKVDRSSSKKIYRNVCRLTPDSFTYDAMLGACAICQDWGSFEATYKQMLLQGYELNCKRHSWILEALGNAGKHDWVESMFTRILSKNKMVTSELYQIMICSCITVSRDEEAFGYLEEMVKQRMSISGKQLQKLQEAACSLTDGDRPRFLYLLDLLQVSSVFTFDRSSKSVSTGGDESLSDKRLIYQELRTSMITHEGRGRTSYRNEATTTQGDASAGSWMRIASTSVHRLHDEGKESIEDIQSPIVAPKRKKLKKPKKPVYIPDPEIHGWELLWTRYN